MATVDYVLVTRKARYVEAQKQYNYAKKFVTISKKVYDEAMKRLVKTQVTSYEVISGDLYLTLGTSTLNGKTVSFPTTSESLNKNHWVLAVPSIAVSAKYDSDVQDAAQGGAPAYSRIKFDQSRTPSTVALVDLIANPGVMYSNQSNPPDRTFTLKRWNDELKASGSTARAGHTKQTADESGGGTYTEYVPGDMPGDPNGTLRDMPPLDDLINDDVDWAIRVEKYYKVCLKYRSEKKKAAEDALKALNDAEKERPGTKITVAPGGGSDKPNGSSTVTDDKKDDPNNNKGNLGVGNDTLPVIYNLPGVKEVYFQEVNPATYVTNGNKPGLVKEASNLWSNSQPHKGMIQSYIVPGKLSKNANWFTPNDVLKGDLKNINTRRYGFQFLYNPSTVSMHYAGAPQVDIGLQTSGADKVPLIGSGVTSSSVTFQLLLNRMQDLKYITGLKVRGGSLENRKLGYFVNTPDSGVRTWVPNLSPIKGLDFKEIYPNAANHPDVYDGTGVSTVWEEVKKIEQLGTMYDVEYLLRTLLGYELMSGIRNRYTADIGYLGAYPVELHLGKNLRYLVTIDSFEISHTIFTQDMIPVFTNLQITCNRLPDFAKRFNELEIKKTNKDDK